MNSFSVLIMRLPGHGKLAGVGSRSLNYDWKYLLYVVLSASLKSFILFNILWGFCW